MMAVAFSARAAADLEEIGAVAFVRETRAHILALDENPGIGAPRPEYGPGVRMLPHGRYLIFYSVSASGVLFERILHGAREIGDLFED